MVKLTIKLIILLYSIDLIADSSRSSTFVTTSAIGTSEFIGMLMHSVKWKKNFVVDFNLIGMTFEVPFV